MKTRLLAAFLSISLLFGSMPVMAAEPTDTPDLSDTVIADDNVSDGEFSEPESSEQGASDDGSSSEYKRDEDDTQDTAADENDSAQDADNDDAAQADPENKDEEDSAIADEDTEDNAELPETGADAEDNAGLLETDTGSEEEAPSDEPLYAEEDAFTALECDKTNFITIVRNPGDNKSVQWFSFTAPEAGYYNFHVNELSSYIRMYLYDAVDGVSMCEKIDYNLNTNYLEKGDTVFLNMYLSVNYNSSSKDIELTVHQITSYSHVKNEDGSCLFDMGNYMLAVSYEIGSFNVRLNTSIEAKPDEALDDSYTFYAYLENKADNSVRLKKKISLVQSGNYQSESYLQTTPGCEYELHIMEVDASNDIVAMCVVDTETVIEETDEKVVIHDIETTPNSIMLDVEPASSSATYCYYAPTDYSVEEDYKTVFGWGKLVFTDLKPDTEYYFQFTDDSERVLYEMTVTTDSYEVEINYSAQISENGQQLELKADIAGYKGSAETASLNYEYINALGEKASGQSDISLRDITSDDNIVKNFTIETSLSLSDGLFEADTQYDITMWVEFKNIDDSGEVIYKEVIPAEVIGIQTPAAAFDSEKLVFSVKTDTDTSPAATCTVKVDDLVTDIYGSIYYKQSGSKTAYRKADNGQNFVLSNTKSSIDVHVLGLKNGITYEFVVIVGGVKKAVITLAGTESIKLSQIGDDEINAFDFVRTYKLDSAGNGNTLSGSYSLNLYYLDKRYSNPKYESLILNVAVFDKDNKYQAQIKTAASKQLEPDMDYDLQWELMDSSDNIVYTCYETIHTKKANIKFEELESNYYLQKYRVTLDSNDILNFENFSVRLYAYIKKDGNASYRNYGKYVDFNKDNEYSDEISISVLEANTSCALSLRKMEKIVGGYVEYEYAATTFTTPEDTRKIEMSEVTPDFHSITLKYLITGITPSMSGWAYCYIREKNAGGEWEQCSKSSYYGSQGTAISQTLTFSSYDGRELKDSTEYEYKMVLSNSALSGELDVMLEGTLSTKEDGRTLSGAIAAASYTTADISAVLSGNGPVDNSYIYLFYRKKGDLDWNSADNKSAGQDTYQYNARLTELTPDTAYEYVLVVSDSEDCYSPDMITEEKRRAGGDFTTKKCNYVLELEADNSKLTTNTAVITVTAKNSTEDDRIQVVLSLSDGQEQPVILKRSDDYQAEVTFTNLTPDTEYTIIKTVIKVTENSYDVTIAENECNYKFTTKEVKIPEVITLSRDKLALNALYNDAVYDSYNSEILRADVTPETADKDFVYISSDEAVATVSDDGRVTAVGIGTAEITVESKYDSDIKSVCEVTVKKYAVGYEYENKEPEILTDFNAVYNIYKNSCVEELGLYECDDEQNVTRLSDYTVTSAKTGIAEWKDDRLYANMPGSTSLTFEKDGIKTNLIVNVTAEGRGFGLTGFTTDSDYPAIKEDDGSWTLAYEAGISYTAVIEISPKHEYSPLDFSWNIPEEYSDIAEINDTGVIIPKKDGSIQLIVRPLKYYTIDEQPYINDEVTVTLNIKPVASPYGESVHALANLSETIGDVDFPERWGEGWSWKYPETPLVTNGVYSMNSYPFEAVYSGTESYPGEKTLLVYIGKITGVGVNEVPADEAPEHNQVLEVGTGDVITLSIVPVYQGKISAITDFTAEIPDVKGLTITKTDDRTFTVTVQKKGSYTLKPIIKTYGSDKVLASTKYKIKAVEGKQVAAITLTTDNEGVEIENNTIILDKADDIKKFTLKAEVKDRNGDDIPTALVWKTTDKKVAAAAPASKSDTHSGEITIKGDGHTVISVTAKDAAGLSTELNLEVRDHSPRINTDKASVNLAYDYDNTNDNTGKAYAAAAGGMVEIVPVYNETIDDQNVKLCGPDGETASPDLKILPYNSAKHEYLIQPASDDLETGTYNCSIYVKTSARGEYSYPLKVTVTDKSPGVSANMDTALNVFFKNTMGYINIKVSGEGNVGDVIWDDVSPNVNNGFSIINDNSNPAKNLSVLSVSQQSNLNITDGKLVDPDVAIGTLTVKINGYKNPYTFNNFKIKYNYKKPVLVTKNTSSSIVPSVGQTNASFSVYDNTNKRVLFYGTSGEEKDNGFYNEIKCDSDDITLTPAVNSSDLIYSYNGTERSKKFNITVDSPLWREPLTAAHTMKAIKPSAYLLNGTLVYNTNFKSVAYDKIYLKDSINITYSDIEIKGSNAKSQKLLDDDLFIITTDNNEIRVEQSQADLMGASVAAGTYSYKVTPYYTNPDTNESTALNTMTLKLKVVNKAVTAKVSPKGSLDLTYGAGENDFYDIDAKNRAVLVDPKLKNLGTGYSVKSCRLTGEYSNYFTLHEYELIKYNKKTGYHYYISINNDSRVCRLKASQKYRLAIEYTITNGYGEEFTVTSNTFTIKPKQTAPKVKVINNNQTLYAAANGLIRTYSLSLPSYYSIDAASGSIDCNKDGKPDINIVESGSSSLTVIISDKDAVGATANGKTYSIPVTVKLRGRDGIAKDVKVKIKVKIKR